MRLCLNKFKIQPIFNKKPEWTKKAITGPKLTLNAEKMPDHLPFQLFWPFRTLFTRFWWVNKFIYGEIALE
jgi:hypothetical protein